MNAQTLSQLPLALPEILLLILASIVLVVDLFVNDKTRGTTYILAQATLLGLAALTLVTFSSKASLAFSGTFIRDGMGDLLKLFVYVITFAVFLYSKSYLKARDLYRGEYYTLGLFGVLGMMILISAHSFLTIYLGLELLSLCMYAMVALQRDSTVASESAMKYFVLGAIASGMLLYGMSMIYGATGSLDLTTISRQVAAHQQNIVLIFGLVFVIVGVAFKLGAVPFHMWLPDVYQGSPTAVTVYLGSAPKIAAFAMLMRLLVDGLGGLHMQWQDILIILSVASMAIGNLVAIVQTNIKRMLAYSTISHVGFLMLGVIAVSKDGYASAMFYTLVYTLMALGAFGMIMLMSRFGFESDNLDDFRGLNQRSPWFAFIMLIFMFSMAGVPPFVGFWAKLAVIKAIVAQDLVWLAIVAVAFSVIGAFYYLRVIKLMYFDTPQESQAVEGATDLRVLLSLNGLVVLALGLKPDLLLAICNTVLG
ncbi:MAG: NADH-quinone oxidoreductase subunit NuoN [Gammaproteobacteria bacterium]|nr:NADH-quinone oxidoreductase subunit NuoN [Gammaproteobacteria bacterium]